MTSRRRMLHAAFGAAGAVAIAGCRTSPLTTPTVSATTGTDPFTLGIASGYPSADGVVLWTRLATDPRRSDGGITDPVIRVAWEIGTDEHLKSVVSRGTTDALAAAAHSVHVEIGGLLPARWYWYRFTANGHRSRIGRTRTMAPPGAVVDRLRLAIASCQNLEHGYFSAYRHIVADEPDLIVHVGDYIYEGSWGELFRPLELPEAQTLAQYRERYAIYRQDPDLQEAHAMFPWVMVWDDHEVSNDYADASAERITAPEDFLVRRAAAYRAYFEHMPMPQRMAPSGPAMRIDCALRIGRLATLYLLDGRQYRTPQACPPPGRAGGNAVIAADCPALRDPGRTLLGGRQEQWLDREFKASATPWNLIAQQTLVAPLAMPDRSGSTVRVRTDGWDGYPLSRRRLLDSISGHGLRNPVVVGGDLHAFFAADLRAQAATGAGGAFPVVASEFVTTSVASQAPGQAHYDRLKRANEHLRHADGTRRGYLRLTLATRLMQADLMALDDVRRPESGISRQAAFVVEDGRPGPQPA